MQSNESILIVLIVVLVVVVVCNPQICPQSSDNNTCTSINHKDCDCDYKDHFQSCGGCGNQHLINAMRGMRHDGYNQPHPVKNADLAKNYNCWSATPDDLTQAQRNAWFEITSNGENSQFNPECPDTQHMSGSSLNYQDALVDLVADPRMRQQHSNWSNEVAPKSQTAMRVDDMDEASAMSSYNGHGLYTFRHAAPCQSDNKLFVTEEDPESFAKHTTKFTFGG